MTSAGKWVLGLLLLVVGAVFVARTVSSDPGSQAQVKLPSAENAGAAKQSDEEKAKAAAEAAAKKVASTVAGDLACKKACVEVNEVANDAVTTAKLAPGSVTLSKLAFEVPNLNELENEINARKATEAALKASQAEAAAAGAKNDAAITAAASNGITAEAAARAAADEALGKQLAAGDADLLGKLNKEITDRGAADDVLQGKLNTEIADRAGAILNLKGELANPNQVAAPIIAINNNEIVANAVTGDKILDATISAADLGNDSVVGGLGGDIKDGTITAHDLGNDSVVGGLGGDIKDGTVSEDDLADDSVIGGAGGDIKDGTVSEHDLADASVIGGAGGDIKDGTVSEDDLADASVIGGAGGDIKDGTVSEHDLADASVIGGAGGDVLDGSIDAHDLATGAVVGGLLGDVVDGSVTGQGDNDLTALVQGDLAFNTVGRKNLVAKAVDTAQLEDSAVTSAQIALNTITNADVSIVDATNLTGANIRTGTIEGQGDNDETAAISGDLGAETVGRKNIVDEAIDLSKLDSTFYGTLLTEDEFAAALALMKGDDGSATPGDRKPNDGDGFLHWNNLEGIPSTILDADGKVTTLKNDLKTADSGAPGGVAVNDGDGLVHWTNLDGVPETFVDGVVSFSELSGVPAILADGAVDFSELTAVPTALTNAYADNLLDFNDVSGTIGVAQIADDTVDADMLAPTLRTTITTLVTDVDALKQQFIDLADPAKTAPAVASTHLTGGRLDEIAAAASAPNPIGPGAVGSIVLTVPDIGAEDIFTVTSPLDWPAGLLVQRSDVTVGGTITVTVFNATAVAQTVPTGAAASPWKVRWIDLTP